MDHMKGPETKLLRYKRKLRNNQKLNSDISEY